VSHVVEYAPGAVEQKLRNITAAKMAAECQDNLELVLPKGHTIGEDGHVRDANGQLVTKGGMHYRTWKDDHSGRLVGDWPMPTGMTLADVGENAVAILRVKDKSKVKSYGTAPYEIGLVPHVDKKTGEITYSLAHDFYQGGYGIEDIVGKTEVDRSSKKVISAHGEYLMFYQMMSAKLAAQESGWDINFKKLADGTYEGVADTANTGLNQAIPAPPQY